MAPKRARSDGGNHSTAKPNTLSSRVVTRSSTRRVKENKSANSVPPVVQLQKKHNTNNKKKKKKTQNSTSKNEGGESTEIEKASTPQAKMVDGGSKTIVVEHCKQCNSFKTRAVQVKIGLEDGLSGISVVLNPEKPRRGCFEIREEGGVTFISLLDMKRPFTPMKALDMEKVISDIIDKIK